VLLVTVRFPVCAPALVGAKTTPAVQPVCGAREDPQVLFTTWKPAGAARTRLLKLSAVPELLTVTVVGLLVAPTPVVAKLMVEGDTWIAAATAPVPLNRTLAGVAGDAAVTCNVPVTTPVAVGVKITPTEQFAPAARLLEQVLWVKLNGAEAASFKALAAALPASLMVTVCAALDWPVTVAGKVNCAGLTFSPFVAVAEPFSGTETGFTPRVEEEITSVAALPPEAPGVKTTCTVQLLPVSKVAPQVVAPVAKLLAN